MKKTTIARKSVGGKKRPIMKVSKNPVRPTKYEHQFDVENKLDGSFSFTIDSTLKRICDLISSGMFTLFPGYRFSAKLSDLNNEIALFLTL